MILEWSIRVPLLPLSVLNSELRHCGVHSTCEELLSQLNENPPITRIGGSERAKVVLQYVTECRHDIGELTDACVADDSPQFWNLVNKHLTVRP